MAGKKKSMGRGLGSLLDRRTTGSASPQRTATGGTSATDDAMHSPLVDSPNAQSGEQSKERTRQQANEQANERSAEKSNARRSNQSDVKHEKNGSDAAHSDERESVASDGSASGDKLRLLGVDQIHRGTYQPRRQFDPHLLQELADSLKSEGLIQPILVRPSNSGQYELIAGERRWRAAQLAGLIEIPAIVRTLDDRAVAAMSLIENIQRKDLNPLEEAEALHRLCDEFGLSHQQVATSIGRSRSSVTNLMRLLDLHSDVKALVDAGELDMGHARALLGAPAEDQPTLARRIAQQGLTVRAVERQIKALRAGKEPRSASKEVRDPDIERLAKHLGDKLGAQVSIRHKATGTGKLEISYNSLDELDGILNHFK